VFENPLYLILEFVIVFLIIYFMNYLILERKSKIYDKDKIPVEISYITSIYKIDITKVNYRALVRTYSLTNTLIMTITYMIVMYLIHEWLYRIIIGIVILILLIIISYGIIGRIYRKKEKENV